ncbi:MAG: TlpA disulfide reductase family protein [Chitinophagaceae bacterium]
MLLIKRTIAGVVMVLTAIIADCKPVSAEGVKNIVCFIVDTVSVKNGKLLNKSFYYHDIALRGHPVYFIGDTFQVVASQPFMLLQANESQNPYLIYPGETIHVTFLETGEAYMSVPGNSERTNELNFFTKLVQQTNNLSYAFKPAFFQKKINSLQELNQCETLINKVKLERLNFLAQYAKTNAIGNEFVAIAKNCIKSVAFRDSVELYAVNSSYLKKQGVYDSKISGKRSSIANIELEYLRYPLQSLADLANVLASDNVRYLSYEAKDFEGQYKSVKEHFAGKYRAYLLFKTLMDATSHFIDIPERYLNDFYSTCTDSLYLHIITTRLKERKGVIAETNDAVIDEAGQRSDLFAILKNYSGNVVLLDFWASWCAPCRAEMKHSKKLEEQLAGKPVKFVYLSIDEDREDWMNAMKKERLDSNSFLILNPGRTTILKSSQVVSIPKYILLDKSGKIISDDAPRPSDPSLLTLIEKNL